MNLAHQAHKAALHINSLTHLSPAGRLLKPLVQQEVCGVHMSATEDCIACDEGDVEDCPNPQRSKCGHHCNHMWTHQSCCWCAQEAEIL